MQKYLKHVLHLYFAFQSSQFSVESEAAIDREKLGIFNLGI